MSIDGARKAEHAFYAKSGRVIRTVSELADAFAEMSDEEYASHAAQDRNDFATWVNDVFKEKELALRLKEAKHKDDALLCVVGHLVESSARKIKEPRDVVRDESAASVLENVQSKSASEAGKDTKQIQNAKENTQDDQVHGLSYEMHPEMDKISTGQAGDKQHQRNVQSQQNHSSVQRNRALSVAQKIQNRNSESKKSWFSKLFSGKNTSEKEKDALLLKETKKHEELVKQEAQFSSVRGIFGEQMHNLFEMHKILSERFVEAAAQAEKNRDENEARLELALAKLRDQEKTNAALEEMCSFLAKSAKEHEQNHKTAFHDVSKELSAICDQIKESDKRGANVEEASANLKTHVECVLKEKDQNTRVTIEELARETAEKIAKTLLAVESLKTNLAEVEKTHQSDQKTNASRVQEENHRITNKIIGLEKQLGAWNESTKENNEDVVMLKKRSADILEEIKKIKASVLEDESREGKIEKTLAQISALASKIDDVHKDSREAIKTLRKESVENMRFFLNEMRHAQEASVKAQKASEKIEKADKMDEKVVQKLVQALHERKPLEAVKFHEIHDIKKSLDHLKQDMARFDTDRASAQMKKTKVAKGRRVEVD